MDFSNLILTFSGMLLVFMIVKTVFTIMKLRTAMKAASFDPATCDPKSNTFLFNASEAVQLRHNYQLLVLHCSLLFFLFILYCSLNAG